VRYEGKNRKAENSVQSMRANASTQDFSYSTGVFPSSPPCPCEAGFELDTLTILHVNIRGWLSHKDELVGHIEALDRKPSILALNETLLDESVSDPKIPGYVLVGRHETAKTKRGIAAYALEAIAEDLVLLEKSKVSERMWLLLHTSIGGILLGIWYRRPDRGEVLSISTLWEEYGRLKKESIGTIIVGDLNVHNRRWLVFSSENTPEGDALHNFCCEHGFSQIVKGPTREENLLDLVLTDLDLGSRVSILPGVSDHSMVAASFNVQVPVHEVRERTVWHYEKANWNEMKRAIAQYDWGWTSDTHPDEAAEHFHSILLGFMETKISCLPLNGGLHRCRATCRQHNGRRKDRPCPILGVSCIFQTHDLVPHGWSAPNVGLVGLSADSIYSKLSAGPEGWSRSAG
jgi:hypothetical protein